MFALGSVLLAVLLLEVGSGLQGALIPVRAELEGFSTVGIGLLGGAYYLGFVAGCIGFPRTVRRVGHVRSYAAVAVVGAVAILVHPLTASVTWFGLRFMLGFCFAGLFMVIESWLNSAVKSDLRGRVLGAYMAATWVGLIGGNLLFPTAPYSSFQLFSLAAVAVALSVVPVSLTYAVPPAIPTRAAAPSKLLRTAPLGVLGCFGTGLTNGAFWTFAPGFAFSTDADPMTVSLFMTACIAGGAVVQWPVGRFSDMFDRRWALLALCMAAAVAGLALAYDGLRLLSAGVIFGATALPVYSVFVAYANDQAESGEYIDMSSLLLLAFGAGALIGPPFAGVVTHEFGLPSLFVFTASIHAGLVAFTFADLLRSAAVPAVERAAFAAHPPIGHGTQTVAELQTPTGVGGDNAKNGLDRSRTN